MASKRSTALKIQMQILFLGALKCLQNKINNWMLIKMCVYILFWSYPLDEVNNHIACLCNITPAPIENMSKRTQQFACWAWTAFQNDALFYLGAILRLESL